MRAFTVSKRVLGWIGLVGSVLGIAGPAGAIDGRASMPIEPPAVVRLEPEAFAYRVAGDFTRRGLPADAPLVGMRIDHPLTIMKTQVSAADFDRCVADGACRPRDAGPGRPDLPAVGVSWLDATAYARWLSQRTGQHWRLPTDAEWSFAAGSRVDDDALAIAAGGDFAERWLAKYEQETRRKSGTDRQPRPFGSFGMNENGLLDIAGNVWEWTDTCFVRQALDEAGEPEGTPTTNCGVRAVAGQHRSYVTDFIRDAKSGGCSVGIPPANLGFRLVRDDRADGGSRLSRLLARFRPGIQHPERRSWHEWPRLE